MLRTFVLGAGALALGVGAAVASGGAVASATPVPVQLSGPIHCAASGLFKFSPKLVNGGTTATAVTLRIKFTGCTGVGTTSGPLTLTGGKFLGTTSTTIANTCGAVLGGTTLPDIAGTVTWKATGGKVVTSSVTVSGEAVYYDPTGNTITTYLPTSITSGSFATQPVTFSGLGSNLNAYKLSQSCGAHGLGSIKFGIPGGSATGAVSVGA